MAAWHTQRRTNGGFCLIGNGSCSPMANIGSSTWNCLTYWNAAHPPAGSRTPPPGCTATSTTSRYDVYSYEISQNWLSDQVASTNETGAPQCTGAPATNNRRLMNIAIVNCMSSPVPIQSNAQNVPVAAFGKFFLTHAAPTAGTNKPFAEFRGIIGRGEGVLYDQVQLYR